MIQPQECASYLARAAIALAGAGATHLEPATGTASEWDQILVDDGPGSRALYAFTCQPRKAELQTKVDRLAERLLAAGTLAGPPLDLVVVVLYPDGVERHTRGAITKVSPSVFYAGLRPETWVVDLVAGKVFGPGVRLASKRRSLLAAPLSGTGEVALGDLTRAESRHAEQRYNFYQLMRGRQPVVTYALIAANVLAYVLLAVEGGPTSSSALISMGALVPRLVEQGQWWRLFTEMFLHGGDVHILFNMMSLFVVGTLAERLYGSARFLGIYLGAGVIGSLVSFLYSITLGTPDIIGVGASGAIFGAAGALVTLRFQRSDVIPQALRDRISSSMIPLVLLSLVLAFTTQHVDNSAHIGGLLAGMALSLILPLPRRVEATPR